MSARTRFEPILPPDNTHFSYVPASLDPLGAFLSHREFCLNGISLVCSEPKFACSQAYSFAGVQMNAGSLNPERQITHQGKVRDDRPDNSCEQLVGHWPDPGKWIVSCGLVPLAGMSILGPFPVPGRRRTPLGAKPRRPGSVGWQCMRRSLVPTRIRRTRCDPPWCFNSLQRPGKGVLRLGQRISPGRAFWAAARAPSKGATIVRTFWSQPHLREARHDQQLEGEQSEAVAGLTGAKHPQHPHVAGRLVTAGVGR